MITMIKEAIMVIIHNQGNPGSKLFKSSLFFDNPVHISKLLNYLNRKS